MVNLSAEARAFVEAKIRSGEYPDEEAVLTAAIEALQRREARDAATREIERRFFEAPTAR